MITLTFKGRQYQVIKTCPVHALLAADGLKAQVICEGERGATMLLQSWANGQRRAIWAGGRVENEYRGKLKCTVTAA